LLLCSFISTEPNGDWDSERLASRFELNWLLHGSLHVHKEIFESMTQLYETMYILRPDLGEEVVGQAIEKYQTLLKDGGAEVLETQHRGKRRLAYEIKKQREGVYIQMNYRGNGTQVAVLERAMRLGDEVIRYLTIRQEEPKAEAAADE
jgi:small subunit ribosomal protein S6